MCSTIGVVNHNTNATMTDEEREKLRHMVAALNMCIERIEVLEKMIERLDWQISVMIGVK